MKCIIIEDEKPAQRLLQSYIKKTSKLDLIACYDAAIEADLKVIQSSDILFLDIKLPELSVLDFLKTIPRRTEVIITTAYPNYALESFELQIADYLLKPFSFDRFLKAVNRVESLCESKDENPTIYHRKNLFIYSNKTFFRVEIDDILFVETSGDYISVYTQNKKWLLNDTLKNWLKKLPSKQFIKTHQSFIVNKEKIDKLQGNLIFIQDFKIPISRIQRKNIINALK